MILVKNIEKLEKNDIKDFTGKIFKVSRMTVGVTALAIFLIAPNSQKNRGKEIVIDEFLIEGCTLSMSDNKKITYEDVYLNKCEKIISEMDSNSKFYILDNVILDVIKNNISANINLKNIDDNDSLEEQIKQVAENISNHSEEYKSIYGKIYSDDIEDCLGTFTITSYCSCLECCDKADGITASGKVATPNHTIAADKSIPFGTKLMIDGIVYTVEDVGGAINGNHIDVFYSSHSEALEAGARSAKVYLVSPEEKKITH